MSHKLHSPPTPSILLGRQRHARRRSRPPPLQWCRLQLRGQTAHAKTSRRTVVSHQQHRLPIIKPASYFLNQLRRHLITPCDSNCRYSPPQNHHQSYTACSSKIRPEYYIYICLIFNFFSVFHSFQCRSPSLAVSIIQSTWQPLQLYPPRSASRTHRNPRCLALTFSEFCHRHQRAFQTRTLLQNLNPNRHSPYCPLELRFKPPSPLTKQIATS